MMPSGNGDSRDRAVRRGARDLSTYRPDETEADAVVRAELSEPDTEDYGLITDYLAGELSPADRERYEQRMRTDPEFRDAARRLTQLPAPTP